MDQSHQSRKDSFLMILKFAINNNKKEILDSNILMMCHLQHVQRFLGLVVKHVLLIQTAAQENSALFMPKELSEAILNRIIEN